MKIIIMQLNIFSMGTKGGIESVQSIKQGLNVNGKLVCSYV